jgi:transposase
MGEVMTSHVIDWFAGIDWGSERHQVCVLSSSGEIVAERDFVHTGAGLAELGAWLAKIAGEAPKMAVGIEVPHGPVVDLLLDRSFVVYAINPKQLDRLRDRFSMAGSKDDRRDARVAASGLRTDRHLFRLVQACDPATVELREWSRLAEELQQDRVRLCNRLRQQLWRYYPQFLELVDDMGAEWLLELWTIAPTPGRAMRLRSSTVARLLTRHRIRRFDASSVLGILRKPTIQVAAGVTEAATLHVRSLIARLRLANQELRTAEKRLDELLQQRVGNESRAQDREPSDAAILTSLPGIGRVALAILLAEASDPLSRRDYAALRALSGVAPVTKRSGKSRIVSMRYAAHPRLRNAVFYWVRAAVQNDAEVRRRYQALRQRGHSYGRALRGLADRLLGVACILLHRREMFDPTRRSPKTT